MKTVQKLKEIYLKHGLRASRKKKRNEIINSIDRVYDAIKSDCYDGVQPTHISYFETLGVSSRIIILFFKMKGFKVEKVQHTKVPCVLDTLFTISVKE